MFKKNIPIFTSTAICSVIIYQSILIAPLINNYLNTSDASILLRILWPKFFIVILILSLISIVFNFYNEVNFKKDFLFQIISIISMVMCLILTPYMNELIDNGYIDFWMILHLSTIILTLVTLIVNLLLIFFWKFKV